jgi:hypothetical protein
LTNLLYLPVRVGIAMDCWDYKACGKKESCPAFPLSGRRCALVLGTLCHGEKQDCFSDKLYHCTSCEYFKREFHVRSID